LIGAILSGGENRRIPVLKGFLKVSGQTILERSIAVLSRVFDKVVISTNMPEQYFALGIPMIGEIRKEKCPMTGILSVLVATGADAVFVVGCDMPFISENLIRFMVQEHRARGAEQGYDAVIPVFRGKKEPLFGIYTKALIPFIETTFQGGERRITEMLVPARVRYVTEDEVRAVDPLGDSFVNVNTMEDYEAIATGFGARVAQEKRLCNAG